MERADTSILVMKGWLYKHWWSGKGDRVGDVGDMVNERLCEKVVEVSDRVKTVVVFMKICRLICGYIPENVRSFEDKQSFDDELKCEWNMHSAIDLVMYWLTIMGTFGKYIDKVHGGYGVRQRNLQNTWLLR